MNAEYSTNIDALVTEIPRLCNDYNLHGQLVERKNSDPTAEPEYYIVVGMNEIPSEDPKKIASRIEQSFLLFYPHQFAIKVTEYANPLELMEKTVEYCTEAEFIKAIYSEFRCDVPEVIRVDELYGLVRFNDQRFNKELDPESRKRFHNGIQEFFKREKTSNSYTRAWIDHYRSGKYDEGASFFARYINFFRRKKNEVSLRTLHKSCDNLKTTVMNENEYKYFKAQIKKHHPDIMYSVGDKRVIDHGVFKMPDGVTNPFGDTVTFDEFFKRREETFYLNGFEDIKNMNVSYWEFRDITFRAADEAVIASVINPFRFNFIKDNELSTISALGPSDTVRVPVNEMMNFYSLARSYHLPFYMDHLNQYGDGSLAYVNVVYSQASQRTVDRIMGQLVSDKMAGSHMIASKQNKHLLSAQINYAANQEAQKRQDDVARINYSDKNHKNHDIEH